LTVAVAPEPLGATEKSGPVPASVTVCGLPGALLLMEMAALRGPIPAGVKVTLIWQLAPTGSEEPQALLCAKSPGFAPVMEMPEMASGVEPVFARVARCAELVEPMARCENVSAAGVKLAVVAPAEVATVSVSRRACVRVEEVPTTLTK
jgi:hypothetical protein